MKLLDIGNKCSNFEEFKSQKGKTMKVSSICMCKECQKRKMPELFLEDMNGNYTDCIKVSDLFTGEYQLSNDLDELQQNE